MLYKKNCHCHSVFLGYDKALNYSSHGRHGFLNVSQDKLQLKLCGVYINSIGLTYLYINSIGLTYFYIVMRTAQ